MPRELIKSWTKKDFKVEYFRGSGPGGQHRNKRDTACRIVHIESGLSASAQDSKSQHTNKRNAFKKLADKLIAHYNIVEAKERYSAGKEVTRTYNKSKDRVVDHLTGERFSYKLTIGKGDISEIIESRKSKAEK